MCQGMKHSLFRLVRRNNVHSKNTIRIFGYFMTLTFIINKQRTAVIYRISISEVCRRLKTVLQANQITNYI